MTTPCDENFACGESTFDNLKLVREGTSQAQRFLAELNPLYVSVNERKPEHSLVFAQAYSAFLNFYDSNNTISGSWQGFFSQDISVLLARLAISDIESYKYYVKSKFDYLNDLENKSHTQTLKEQLGLLFACVASLVKQLDDVKNSLPKTTVLYSFLNNLIDTKLSSVLDQLIGYYKAGISHHLIVEIPLPDTLEILGGKGITFSKLIAEGISSEWYAENTWALHLQNIDENIEAFGVPASVFTMVNHIATHNIFNGAFDQFLKVYVRVVLEAQQSLESSYEATDHQPHYGLFIAFVRLFEHARGEANLLTQRHLDYYYRTILQLKEKPAEPAKAHVLVELAKQVSASEIQVNSLLQAGKDGLGKSVYFANSEMLVANQASVTELKSLYRYFANTPAEQDKNEGRIYASPIANSADGIGAAILNEDRSWHPFSNKNFKIGKLNSIQMPPADLGFAIASHYLLMAEGSREIVLKLKCSGTLPVEFSPNFTCLLSSSEGWLETPMYFDVEQEDALYLYFYVELTADKPALVPINYKLHGDKFPLGLPVMQIKLAQNDQLYNYQQLCDFKIQSIDVNAYAGGIKNLALSNDFGPIDSSKPFQPFGAIPQSGNSLIIGAKEVFQKKLDYFSLYANYQIPPKIYHDAGTSYVGPSISLNYLYQGFWSDSGLNEVDYVSSGIYLSSSSLPVNAWRDSADFTSQELFSNKEKLGYFQCKINGEFGYDAYQKALITKIINKDTTTQLQQPVAAVIDSISLNYAASQFINLIESTEESFSSRAAKFYQIGPFGISEQHPFLKPSFLGSDVFLLPQFTNSKQEAHEAEFYLGISGLLPPQNISILFQVADGTSDPLVEKPEHHIAWSYLANNEWIPFANNEINDRTDDLINSGIITFSCQREMTSNNSILPAGLSWIRGTVLNSSGAVCKLKLVAAQAMLTSFIDKGNDPAFNSSEVAPNTIAKLDVPNSNIKKISQPFASFGGRASETTSEFYTRISERLRHKERAISLWDYEHLVLESFPQVYIAKCLNHTRYETCGSKSIYNELAPGHVTLVTIPVVSLQNVQDPLRPYSSIGLLQNIKKFLSARMSPFIQLHVANPEFESVRVEFNVCLRDGFDESFSIKKLQESITQYLSPWAFNSHAAPNFGGGIYKSVLVNFIEDQPCVDFITDIKLFRGESNTIDEGDQIVASKALSILVSVPAEFHKISAIKYVERISSNSMCQCES